MEISINDRMNIANLCDSLIYDSNEVFNKEDALNLLDMVRDSKPPNFMSIKVKSNIGCSTQGNAAGFGSVQIEDKKEINYDSEEGVGIRAGQWKVAYNKPGWLSYESVKIEQFMTESLTENRAAMIVFYPYKNPEMRIIQSKALDLYFLKIGFAKFVKWKECI